MRRDFPGRTLALLGILLLGSCSEIVLPTPPSAEVSQTLPQLESTVVMGVRLPLIANGSELTPTPFQPIPATPVFSPTQAPTQARPLSPARSSPDPRSPAVTAIPSPMPLLGDQGTAGDHLLNILLIGSDQRARGAFRTDTLIIASIRPPEQIITLISIPRDLFVFIPGWTMQRSNTAYLHGETSKYPGGGAALLKDTILYNLGVRIDHLAIVNFKGYKTIVDTLGGIDLPLACAYTDWRVIDPEGDLENPNNWRLYTAGPGMVHMDGELALWYARSRLRSNDYDRGRRQQEVLRGMYAQAMQMDIAPRLPELFKQVGGMVQTDLSLEQILALVPMALKLNAQRIRSFYINNRLVKAWWTPQGAQVLLPKRQAIEALIQEAMSPPDAGEEQRQRTLIEVQNATGGANWDVLAAERLHYAGFDTRLSAYIGDGKSKTRLYDLNGGKYPDQSASLLALFGLPADRLKVDANPGIGVSYLLILGSDFDPCFNPSKINH